MNAVIATLTKGVEESTESKAGHTQGKEENDVQFNEDASTSYNHIFNQNITSKKLKPSEPELDHEFSESSVLSRDRKKKLAEKFNCKESYIKNWFIQRRAKQRNAKAGHTQGKKKNYVQFNEDASTSYNHIIDQNITSKKLEPSELELDHEFSLSSVLRRDRKKKLAEKFHCKESYIRYWFIRRRAKQRNDTLKKVLEEMDYWEYLTRNKECDDTSFRGFSNVEYIICARTMQRSLKNFRRPLPISKQKPTYKCAHCTCSTNLASRIDAIRHVSNHNLNERILICQYCNIVGFQTEICKHVEKHKKTDILEMDFDPLNIDFFNKYIEEKSKIFDTNEQNQKTNKNNKKGYLNYAMETAINTHKEPHTENSKLKFKIKERMFLAHMRKTCYYCNQLFATCAGLSKHASDTHEFEDCKNPHFLLNQYLLKLRSCCFCTHVAKNRFSIALHYQTQHNTIPSIQTLYKELFRTSKSALASLTCNLCASIADNRLSYIKHYVKCNSRFQSLVKSKQKTFSIALNSNKSKTPIILASNNHKMKDTPRSTTGSSITTSPKIKVSSLTAPESPKNEKSTQKVGQNTVFKVLAQFPIQKLHSATLKNSKESTIVQNQNSLVSYLLNQDVLQESIEHTDQTKVIPGNINMEQLATINDGQVTDKTEKQMKCSLCDFKDKNLDVMVKHTKSSHSDIAFSLKDDRKQNGITKEIEMPLKTESLHENSLELFENINILEDRSEKITVNEPIRELENEFLVLNDPEFFIEDVKTEYEHLTLKTEYETFETPSIDQMQPVELKNGSREIEKALNSITCAEPLFMDSCRDSLLKKVNKGDESKNSKSLIPDFANTQNKINNFVAQDTDTDHDMSLSEADSDIDLDSVENIVSVSLATKKKVCLKCDFATDSEEQFKIHQNKHLIKEKHQVSCTNSTDNQINPDRYTELFLIDVFDNVGVSQATGRVKSNAFFTERDKNNHSESADQIEPSGDRELLSKMDIFDLVGVSKSTICEKRDVFCTEPEKNNHSESPESGNNAVVSMTTQCESLTDSENESNLFKENRLFSPDNQKPHKDTELLSINMAGLSKATVCEKSDITCNESGKNRSKSPKFYNNDASKSIIRKYEFAKHLEHNSLDNQKDPACTTKRLSNIDVGDVSKAKVCKKSDVLFTEPEENKPKSSNYQKKSDTQTNKYHNITSKKRKHNTNQKNISFFDKFTPEQLRQLCYLCGQLFDSQSKLWTHISVWHEGKYEKSMNGKLQCGKCDFNARDKNVLRKHRYSVHSKPLCCGFCNYKIRDRNLMILHKDEVHIKKTEQTSSHKLLNKTKNLHINIQQIKVYQNTNYGMQIKNSNIQDLHTNSSQTSVPIFLCCTICPFKTIDKVTLEDHIYAHKKGFLTCSVCTFMTIDKGNLVRHKKDAHKVIEDEDNSNKSKAKSNVDKKPEDGNKDSRNIPSEEHKEKSKKACKNDFANKKKNGTQTNPKRDNFRTTDLHKNDFLENEKKSNKNSLETSMGSSETEIIALGSTDESEEENITTKKDKDSHKNSKKRKSNVQKGKNIKKSKKIRYNNEIICLDNDTDDDGDKEQLNLDDLDLENLLDHIELDTSKTIKNENNKNKDYDDGCDISEEKINKDKKPPIKQNNKVKQRGVHESSGESTSTDYIRHKYNTQKSKSTKKRNETVKKSQNERKDANKIKVTFKCPYCSYRSVSRYALEVHFDKHHLD